AKELPTGNKVALKVLSLQRIQDFKALDLFEREAKILSQLAHPSIPHYIDYFEIKSENNSCFYLVQEVAKGKPLNILIKEGWQPSEREVKKIAIQILEILKYLQQLIPPVIHRDIKPENIIYSDEGKVSLVDFGAVQDVYHQTVTGRNTVVGTYGYMAPEQFYGQAVLSTDLYGLGATLIYLLTRKFPSDLPQRNLRIDFQKSVNIDKKFSRWLKRMIEPVVEDRFSSAIEALAILQGEQSFYKASFVKKAPSLKFTKITYINDGNGIIIDSPAIWFGTQESRSYIVMAFFLFGSSYVTHLLLVYSQTMSFVPLAPIEWMLPKLFLFLGLFLCALFIKQSNVRTLIKIEHDNFYFQQWMLGYCYREVNGKTYDMNPWKLNQEQHKSFTYTTETKVVLIPILNNRIKKYKFGFLLSEAEKKWIISTVNTFLKDLTS
ncbi:MAG: serine/threonine-protein kinase, partial [Cyanobacteria bacterium J06573_2]